MSCELQKRLNLDSPLFEKCQKWDPREKRIREVFANPFLEIGLTILTQPVSAGVKIDIPFETPLE